jgi:adenylate cyclase
MSGKPTKPHFHGVEAGEYWHGLLTGDGKGLGTASRIFRRVPRSPRCKLCQAPFDGPLAPLFRLVGFRRWKLNEQLCRYCVAGIEKVKGGTEVDVSMLFADVRGSTRLAETMSPSEFSSAMDKFFGLAFEAVDSEDGVVDHIVGDGVMAFWVPGFVGERHPRAAVTAGRKLAAALSQEGELGASFPVGIGVHTGQAFAGVVGETGSLDFTILGDIPNTTARLGSAAMGGELVLSDDVARAAGIETDQLERRLLTLKGKTEPVSAWIETEAPLR